MSVFMFSPGKLRGIVRLICGRRAEFPVTPPIGAFDRIPTTASARSDDAGLRSPRRASIRHDIVSPMEAAGTQAALEARFLPARLARILRRLR
jgi:hypothetical protein